MTHPDNSAAFRDIKKLRSRRILDASTPGVKVRAALCFFSAADAAAAGRCRCRHSLSPARQIAAPLG